MFITDAFINSPVDLAGRLRITTFRPYVSNLGTTRRRARRTRPRSTAMARTSRPSAWRATARRTCCRAAASLDCDDGEPTDFGASDRFETVYDADGVTIWRLRP